MIAKEILEEHGITFSNGRFVSHLLLSNAGIRVDSFKIYWPGNPIDGHTIIRQVYTPRKKHAGWGKGEACFFLEQEKKLDFPTLELFIQHYAIKK